MSKSYVSLYHSTCILFYLFVHCELFFVTGLVEPVSVPICLLNTANNITRIPSAFWVILFYVNLIKVLISSMKTHYVRSRLNVARADSGSPLHQMRDSIKKQNFGTDVGTHTGKEITRICYLFTTNKIRANVELLRTPVKIHCVTLLPSLNTLVLP